MCAKAPCVMTTSMFARFRYKIRSPACRTDVHRVREGIANALRAAPTTSAERVRRFGTSKERTPGRDQRRGVDAAEPERGELAPLSASLTPCRSLYRRQREQFARQSPPTSNQHWCIYTWPQLAAAARETPVCAGPTSGILSSIAALDTERRGALLPQTRIERKQPHRARGWAAMSSERSMTPTQDSPKSVSLMCPAAPISRLSGFRSRWMMPCSSAKTHLVRYIGLMAGALRMSRLLFQAVSGGTASSADVQLGQHHDHSQQAEQSSVRTRTSRSGKQQQRAWVWQYSSASTVSAV